ncbi:hypothetical protein [Nocardia salmonicida]|uniref:hypothetical protein n=1 Tax=Nocardia salmonicida TaxID=53431 RepID=UPI0037B7A2CC
MESDIRRQSGQRERRRRRHTATDVEAEPGASRAGPGREQFAEVGAEQTEEGVEAGWWRVAESEAIGGVPSMLAWAISELILGAQPAAYSSNSPPASPVSSAPSSSDSGSAATPLPTRSTRRPVKRVHGGRKAEIEMCTSMTRSAASAESRTHAGESSDGSTCAAEGLLDARQLLVAIAGNLEGSCPLISWARELADLHASMLTATLYTSCLAADFDAAHTRAQISEIISEINRWAVLHLPRSYRDR